MAVGGIFFWVIGLAFYVGFLALLLFLLYLCIKKGVKNGIVEAHRDVTERGLSYTLERAPLTAHFPLGVSNSFTGEAAEISVESGTLIVYWQDDPALPLPERGKI